MLGADTSLFDQNAGDLASMLQSFEESAFGQGVDENPRFERAADGAPGVTANQALQGKIHECPLSEYPAISHQTADEASEFEAACLPYPRTAWCLHGDGPLTGSAEAAMARHDGNDAATDLRDARRQVICATDTAEKIPFEGIVRQARTRRMPEGASEIQSAPVTGEGKLPPVL